MLEIMEKSDTIDAYDIFIGYVMSVRELIWVEQCCFISEVFSSLSLPEK